MAFNSITFILFFAIVLGVDRAGWLSWGGKKLFLLCASYLFYASWNPPFVVLLWISTVVDFVAAQRIARADTRGRKRFWLIVSLGVNLGMLAAFKYGNFLLEIFGDVLGLFGLAWEGNTYSIIFPAGISFYTFQTLSYTLDVYKGKLKPDAKFLDFALFVTFFPQLVAGPIVRAADFLPQIIKEKRATANQLGWGLVLITIGIFIKVVLADGILANAVNMTYSGWESAGLVMSWVGTTAFSGQIYFDFAGYSLTAIGCALCLGLVLPDNFNFPYAAIGFSDFWRRWHISLSTWLRDYLYLPLGGNRAGVSRTYVNLMMTMLLGGLWHGASWRFVAWGGLHGLYLVLERLFKKAYPERRWMDHYWMQLLAALGTYVLVCFTWVFFRAQSFDAAFFMIKSMLGFHPHLTGNLVSNFVVLGVAVVVFSMLFFNWFLRHTSLEAEAKKMPWWSKAVVLSAMWYAIVLAPGERVAFIYFQF
ncbi:MBOAT family protein [bacterium]|nr:MBOAT family protein [bacterium]